MKTDASRLETLRAIEQLPVDGEKQPGHIWKFRTAHPKIHIGRMMKRVLRGEFKRTLR